MLSKVIEFLAELLALLVGASPSCATSLSLSFLIHEMGLMIVPISEIAHVGHAHEMSPLPL